MVGVGDGRGGWQPGPRLGGVPLVVGRQRTTGIGDVVVAILHGGGRWSSRGGDQWWRCAA
ncbi:hypothetical protein Dimus_037048, partial [Dionaea muscipula]